MSLTVTEQEPAAAEAAARRAARALGWNTAWLVAVAAFGLAIAVGYPEIFPQAAAAVFAMTAPALVGMLAARARSELVRSLMLVLWGLGGGIACTVGGGISGPLAVWCLAPVAAASATGGPRRMAEGAALAFMAAAVAGMAQVSGVSPPAPQGVAAFWLGLLALTTTGLGLGAGLILVQRQVTAREGRLGAEVAALTALLDGQPHLLAVLSPHGWVRSAFGRAPEGVDRASLLRRGLAAAAALGDRAAVAGALRRASEEGRAEVSFAPAAALGRWAAASLRRLDDGRLVAVVRDDTEARDREAGLEQAKADAEALAAGKSRFLANMSHELRTPLNAIMGFSDIMKARMFGVLPDKYAEYGALIHESGAHLLDLINDVLDMSKIEAERYELSREVFDAREAISAALRLMRLQADGVGVQLRGVLPPGALEIDADRRALKQIVLNLVSNALKFTPKGGSVTVTADGFDGIFELVVSDTGVGISKEDLDRLGRPYEQADAGRQVQGTGLGLSLVRSFAELHGGDMIIESALGEGASVTVRLPVLVPPSEAAPPEPLGENVVVFNPQR